MPGRRLTERPTPTPFHMRTFGPAAFALLAALAALWPTPALRPAGAQAPAPEAPTTTQPAIDVGPTPGPADSYQRGVPRRAVRGYLDAANASDWERAAHYLDLRRVPRVARALRGQALARELKTVLDRTLPVRPERLSDGPAGELDDGAAPRRDLLGTIDTSAGPVDLWLEHVPREDGVLVWKVSAATVGRIPALYAEFGYPPVVDRLPAVLLRVRFAEIPLWQWIGFVIAGLASGVGAWVVAWVVLAIARPIVTRTRGPVDHRVLAAVRAPLRLALALWLFGGAARALRLALPVQRVVNGIEEAGVLVLWAWLGLRLVDVAHRIMAEQLVARGEPGALSMLPLGRRTAKVAIVGLAAIAALQGVGFNITGILAGLGVGGLAVALAAQKTVENLFGGMILVADQPLRVGDFCRVGQQLGTVEDIGMRSTRVRTPERTIVTIPNGALSAMEIENFSRRDRIRLTATVALRRDTTAEQVRRVLDAMAERLRQQARIDPGSVSVRLARLAAAGPEIEVAAYARTRDADEFLAIREEAFLGLLDVLADTGTSLSPAPRAGT